MTAFNTTIFQKGSLLHFKRLIYFRIQTITAERFIETQYITRYYNNKGQVRSLS